MKALTGESSEEVIQILVEMMRWDQKKRPRAEQLLDRFYSKMLAETLNEEETSNARKGLFYKAAYRSTVLRTSGRWSRVSPTCPATASFTAT